MKPFRTACLLLMAFFLQTTAAGLVSLRNIGPNLLLCVTIFLVITSRAPALTVGLCVLTAVIHEICFSIYTGPSGIAIFLAGITVAAAAHFFTWDSPWLWAGITVLETLFYNMVVWSLCRLLGSPYRFAYVLSLQPLFILCNLAMMAVLYFLFIRKSESRYQI